MDDYNAGFKAFISLKEGSGFFKNNYLVEAKNILGSDINFENIQHRLVVGAVLLYQEYGKDVQENKQKILNIANEGVEKYNRSNN